ncbi:hypothetical protein NHX12_004965 [Muraenolepis orangiensis]|uniref:Uncharacterized protein n=1 Tax=Muraenolepis orangiensis TaxID=630683 RepID=A0A9Q0ICQ6_9TELE|nr:hypothetical protein NHX12_004965 [Muraenolepis orangiensis]
MLLRSVGRLGHKQLPTAKELDLSGLTLHLGAAGMALVRVPPCHQRNSGQQKPVTSGGPEAEQGRHGQVMMTGLPGAWEGKQSTSLWAFLSLCALLLPLGDPGVRATSKALCLRNSTGTPAH